jgi:hypothetical protein
MYYIMSRGEVSIKTETIKDERQNTLFFSFIFNLSTKYLAAKSTAALNAVTVKALVTHKDSDASRH